MSKTYQVTNKVVDINTIKTNQVKQLVTILAKHKKKKLTSEQLAEVLKDNELKTKQDPYLIFKYYQKQLVELGVVVVEGVTAAVKKYKFETAFIDGLGI